MACDHVVPLSNEDMIKIDQNVNDDSALITGLEPFSKYTFAVHQNLISHSIEVVTLSERPQTKPNEGKIDKKIYMPLKNKIITYLIFFSFSLYYRSCRSTDSIN